MSVQKLNKTTKPIDWGLTPTGMSNDPWINNLNYVVEGCDCSSWRHDHIIHEYMRRARGYFVPTQYDDRNGGWACWGSKEIENQERSRKKEELAQKSVPNQKNSISKKTAKDNGGRRRGNTKIHWRKR